MSDNLPKDEELKKINAEMYCQQQIILKRNLSLEDIHKNDTKKIMSYLDEIKQLKDQKKRM